MTFEYLQSLLTPVAGVLHVIGTSLENQAVTSLFESYFTNGILSLYNAVTTADEASQTVTVVADIIAGTALRLDFAVLSKSSWILQSDGTVEVLLIIVVNDADWGIVDTFPVLEGSVFSEMAFQDPAFTLDSTAASTLPTDFRKSFGQYTSEPSVEDNLVKGLSLSTQATFEGAAEDFTSLFSPPLQFDGPMETYFKRNPYLSEGWDGTLPPIQALPQLMLSLSEDSRSFTVSGYEFVFQLQVASVLGETAPAKGEALPGVLPVGMLAIRTEFNTDGISLPISAYLTIDSSNTLEFVAGEIPSTPVTPSQLTSLLGGAAMPPEVDGGVVLYKSLNLVTASLTMATSPSLLIERIEVEVALVDPQWTSDDSFLGEYFQLKDLGLNVAATYEGGSFGAEASLFAHVLFNGTIAMSGSINIPELSAFFEVAESQPVDISEVLDKLGISVGNGTWEAAQLEVMAGLRARTFEMMGAIQQDWVIFGTKESGFVLGDISAKFGIQRQNDKLSVFGALYGEMTLGGAQLTMAASYQTDGGWSFTGGTAPGQSVNLTAVFEDLLNIFGIESPALPEVDLDSLDLSFNTKSKTFDLRAVVRAPALCFDLTNLPLVGPYLDPSNTISLRNVVFVIAYNGVDSPGADGDGVAGSTQTTATYLVAMEIDVAFGSTGDMKLQIPIISKAPVVSGVAGGNAPAGGGAQQPGGGAQQEQDSSAPQVTYPTAGSGVWINVQRTFGPLAIQKIGFSLTMQGIGVQFNVALSISGVTITGLGLGLIIPLSSPWIPKPQLHGVGVALNFSAFKASGTLLATGDNEFNGSLSLNVGRFGMTALAAFSTVDPPSFFLFVMVNFPLGGPPIFFVKGLSGGFGFNRDLILPAVADVSSYPLVLGSSPGPANPFGTNPTMPTFTEVMANDMAVLIGEYWGAAGIRFSSYATVDSYALATLAVGTRLQIGLLGMSTLILPPKPGAGGIVQESIAFVQMALDAVFAPSVGELSVCAQLTPSSYVMSQKFQITGGFAFYLWFPPDDNPWQFVISLGGYNPYFKRPSYYPSVPQLALIVKLGPLVIRGNAYFALTGQAAMMGISLNATWQGGPVKASFSMSADFLVQWKPVFYDIQAGLNISLKVNLKLAFVRVSLSVSAGADMRIWGPDFSMTAKVDLVVFSFTLNFGEAATTAPPSLGWSDFEDSFLAAPDSAPQSTASFKRTLSLAAAEPAPITADDSGTTTVVTLQISSGIMRDLTSKGQAVDYVVDPELFTLTTQTQIPTKTLIFNGTQQTGSWNTSFGIGPMNVQVDDFQSTHSISLLYDSAHYGRVNLQPTLMAAPKALWQANSDPNSTMNDSPSVENALQGVTVAPTVQVPDQSLPVTIRTLLFDKSGSYAWTLGDTPAAVENPWTDDDPVTAMTSTIASDLVSGVRSDIVSDLIYNQFLLSNRINTRVMTTSEGAGMLAPVVLVPLGQSISDGAKESSNG